jgi:amino acid transporter
MTGILITFNFASIVFLIWVFVQGFLIQSGTPIRSHIVMALIATALSVFAHCLTMMYAVAVGRMIREAVEKKELDSKYVTETKSYRKSIFKVATIAMLFVMAQTILGGGVHTGVFPTWFHLGLGFIAILVSAYATYLEVRYLIANHLLGHHVAREFETHN